MSKYIFVTGGVSSVGKGITVASIGTILKSRQITVSVQKLDPYLNVDPTIWVLRTPWADFCNGCGASIKICPQKALTITINGKELINTK